MTYIVMQTKPAGIVVTFPYDLTVVDLLKRTVPGYGRKWNPDGKRWTIFEPLAAVAFARAVVAAGHDLEADFEWQRKPKAKPADNWADDLLIAVGPDRREAVFKALVRVLHPDRPDYGDRALFEALDAARRKAAA